MCYQKDLWGYEESLKAAVMRNSNIYIQFTENIFDLYCKHIHDIPVPLPCIPNQFRCIYVGDRNFGEEFESWGLRENRSHVRRVVSEGLLSTIDAVLIPAQNSWIATEYLVDIEIAAYGYSPCLGEKAQAIRDEQTQVKSFLRLVDRMGWAGVCYCHDCGKWWMMFKPEYHDKLVCFYREVREGKEWKNVTMDYK